MAIDALHERLEYLVSYSSQLILIGCESLAQQQSSLQKFLSVQHENTDIAFLNGEIELSNVDYRNEIYQQLTKQSGFHGQTLDNGLLKLLPEDSGPILICICAAQHISNEILNELWQLVRNNKSQKYARHINVLLFGSPDWIADAKLQLVKDTRHLPVLLSTETVEPIATTDNLLDTIRQNRRIVTHRMKSESSNEQDDSIIGKPLFKYAVAVIFLVLFSSIIFWQYPDEIRGFLDPQSTQTVIVDEQSDPEAINQQNSASEQVQKTDSEAPVATEDVQEGVQDPTQDNNVEPAQQDAISSLNALEQTEQNEQTLVTDWQQEVKKIQAQTEYQSSETDILESDTPELTNVNESESVSDISVVEASENQQEQSTSINFEQALRAMPSTHFLLQISAMADQQTMDNFIVQNGLSDDVWLYTTQRFGGDWHVLVHQQVFKTLEQAREYVNQLPENIDRSQPFAKSVQQIKQELAVTQE